MTPIDDVVAALDLIISKLDTPGADAASCLEELRVLEQKAFDRAGGGAQSILLPVMRAEVPTMAPFKPFVPALPVLTGATALYDATELWDWAKAQVPVAVEPLYNGLRVIAERQGDRLKVWRAEEPQRNLLGVLPQLKEALLKIEGSWIFDGDLGLEVNGIRAPRPENAMLLSDLPVFKQGEVAVLTIFDVPFYNEDFSQLSLEARRPQLDRVSASFDTRYLRVCPMKIAGTKEEMQQAVQWAFKITHSEGAMVKTLSGNYPIGEASSWAQLAKVVELHVRVLDRKELPDAMYSYQGGISAVPADPWTNTTSRPPQEYIALGWSEPTQLKAGLGDTVVAQISELIPDEASQTLTWYDAHVVGLIPHAAPFNTTQAIAMASRGGALMRVDALVKAEGSDGEAQGVDVNQFWIDNWYKLYPASGSGRFAYQHHWRGLVKDEHLNETTLSDDALLKTTHSLHGDLRLEADSDLYGLTLFLGATSSNAQKDRFIGLEASGRLEAGFKFPHSKTWLRAGALKPLIVAPGEPGATSQTYAKFFGLDRGTYQIGVRHRHLMELFIHGKQLHGRYLVTSIPSMTGGRRVWVVGKPADQTPMIESKKLDEVAADLRKRGHSKLLWAGPGIAPRLIDLKTLNKQGAVVHKDAMRRLVIGVVMEPDAVDTQGEYATAASIEEAAHNYMIASRTVGLQHTEDATGCHVVESWIAPCDLTFEGVQIRTGTWLMTIKVLNEEIWQAVLRGEFTGFSIGGVATRVGV